MLIFAAICAAAAVAAIFHLKTLRTYERFCYWRRHHG